MNRKLFILRLMLFHSGYRRAEYLKKKKYFHHQGEHCYTVPCNFGTEPYLIGMGDNVYLASGVSFINHDITAAMFQYMEPQIKHVKRVGKIEIGNNVFIGAKATILYDVTIGDNVIIAAGALVNRDVPSGSIYGGVPAKKIGDFTDYMQESRRYSADAEWSSSDSQDEKRIKQIEKYWRENNNYGLTNKG